MEDWAAYFARRTPGADFVTLRFGAVTDEKSYAPVPSPASGLPLWGFVTLARVALADVLRCLQLTVDAPEKPGYRQYNLVGPDTCCDDSVPEIIRAIGGKLDLAAYQRPGHEYDPVYSMDEIRRDLGFVPAIPMRRNSFLQWKVSGDRQS
jgi:nucleoside-diphosphate-sugar epimerase